MNEQSDRRHFQRVNYDRNAQLEINGIKALCEIVDLSLNGALVMLSDPHSFTLDSKGALSFDLGDKEHFVKMAISIAHINQNKLGLQCENIDIESVSHLRKIVELNSGDPELLQRDLESLMHG
ncbi:PilZ domain-containing protein [Pleionea sediminis]|uniref:PilZ domain-containing protein n=1 Tax=Pleionea sediminis TaxID=2569479 RepID=UPI001186FD55|nr:PilZ domain-containing protein [Pleionea sediminis]